MAGATLSLKGRALRYLSAREHSRNELSRKLARHAEDPDQVERVLDELAAKGWLSEARFVESVVHRRAERFGVARIRQELQQHGIAGTDAAAALDTLRRSEPERALEVWRRRFSAPPESPAEKAKQMRFLAGRGFSTEVIRRVMSHLPMGSSDDHELDSPEPQLD
jgi:regulatory protein